MVFKLYNLTTLQSYNLKKTKRQKDKKTKSQKVKKTKDIVVLGKYLMTCKNEILWFWCYISQNHEPWDIVIYHEIWTMGYRGSDFISHKIMNHEKLWFWFWHKICNHEISWFSQNHEPRDIVVLVLYITKSATMRYCGFGVTIFNQSGHSKQSDQ